MANPDETCALCGTTRENHGDAHHEFSEDGTLVMKKKPEPPRQPAPKERDSTPATEQIKAKAFTMLVEILAEKGLLDTKDVIRIFGAAD